MPFYCGKRSADICVVLGPKTSSTYSSEYACGFFEPAASHLPASPFPLATKDYSDRLLAIVKGIADAHGEPSRSKLR
jgi:hypothetical protein